MIPIRDINPTRTFPLITITLIALNISVFLYELVLQGRGELVLAKFIYANGVTPYEITHNVDLPPSSPGSVYVTFLSSLFLHAGFVHIIGNMVYLWIFGNNVEDRLGHLAFLFFYLLAGLGAALAQIAVNVNSTIPSIGASGAIAGILAAYLIMFPRAQIYTLLILGYIIRMVRLPAIVVIGFWLVLQFFNGVASLGAREVGGVAWFAHIGGFVAGLALVPIFGRRRRFGL
ncbi:MAG: rhomboid family intramembrane serine protease [Anaerolineae bacterium]